MSPRKNHLFFLLDCVFPGGISLIYEFKSLRVDCSHIELFRDRGISFHNFPRSSFGVSGALFLSPEDPVHDGDAH